MPFPPRSRYRVPCAHGLTLVLGERPLVMGVLNVTPDSFAETLPLVRGGIVDVGQAADVAAAMEAAGADLIDVGGESTRPGAGVVDTALELERVLPVLRALVRRVRVPLSVDTYKAEVARRAVNEGAAIVNDVSGLLYDPAIGDVVAETGAALVLMHTRGRPQDMYAEARYGDVARDVADELRQRLAAARAAGVDAARVIVDPGIGFAKHAAHSYGLLARLPEIAAALDRPVLVGPSRKSFMREALGDRPAAGRDWGTAAAVTAAVLGGAHVVRVHAVSEMVQVVRVAEAIRRGGVES